METYLVINTETKETYQRNGRVAEFATFYQARQVRITMNDQGKEVRDIEGTTSTYIDRPTPWQVIEASTVTVDPVTATQSRRIAYGTYTRENVVVYYAKGELKPIHRAPNAKRRSKSQNINLSGMATDIASIQSNIKRLSTRIESIDERIKGMQPGAALLKLMERKIGYKIQINELKAELVTKQKAYMAGQQKVRRAQNKNASQSSSNQRSSRRRTS